MKYFNLTKKSATAIARAIVDIMNYKTPTPYVIQWSDDTDWKPRLAPDGETWEMDVIKGVEIVGIKEECKSYKTIDKTVGTIGVIQLFLITFKIENHQLMVQVFDRRIGGELKKETQTLHQLLNSKDYYEELINQLIDQTEA